MTLVRFSGPRGVAEPNLLHQVPARILRLFWEVLSGIGLDGVGGISRAPSLSFFVVLLGGGVLLFSRFFFSFFVFLVVFFFSFVFL